MPIKDIADILKEVTDAETQRLKPLYDKFKENYDIYTFKPYEQEAAKGVFDNMTSNEFGVHGRKVHGLLLNGRPSFSFSLDNETYKTRKEKLSTTERFVYAAMGKADKLLLNSPNNTTVHGALAFYTVHLGGCIPRVLVWEDDEGNPVFDCAVWQPQNVTWQYGYNGMAWVNNKRWATVAEVEELYPDADGREDEVYKGYVLLRDYWCLADKTCWNGVIINDDWASEKADGENGAPYDTEMGSIPVGIFTAGDIPMLQFDDSGAELAHKWYSCYDALRPIIEARHKQLTYRMTLSRKAAERTFIREYDSTKGGIAETPDLSPNMAGSFMNINVGKGEALTPSDPIELTRTVEVLESQLEGMISLGGMSPIAYGQSSGTSTATGIAMLMEANSSYLYPFRLCLERAEQWIASQFIKQTKNGNYKEIESDGLDSKSKPFSLKVKPAELEDEKEIVCKLELKSAVETLQKAGLLTQLNEKGIISKQTAQDNLPELVQDTDAELERIAQERLMEEHPEINLLRALKALQADRKGATDEDLKSILLSLVEQVKERARPKAAPVQGVENGVLPEGANPLSAIAPMQQPLSLDVPQQVSNAIRMNEQLQG